MFLYHHWTQLPLSTRNKIAQQFRIERKNSIEVFNDTIKSDGYLIKDIEEALNVDAIQIYLSTEETDMQLLWSLLVDKIEGRIVIEVTPDPIVDVIAPQPTADVSTVIKSKKKNNA